MTTKYYISNSNAYFQLIKDEKYDFKTICDFFSCSKIAHKDTIY